MNNDPLALAHPLQRKIPPLIQSLEFAIIELSAKLLNQKVKPSAEDEENCHYVLGVCRLTSASLAYLLTVSNDDFDFDMVRRATDCMEKAQAFVAELNALGFGIK